MKYINLFKNHSSYEEKLNGGGVDISLPNVSYCKDVKDVHYNPYNTVEFYVGDITPQQTVKVYTDKTTSIDIQVSENNKWYSYVLPKYKGLFKIKGDSVKKVVVKADMSYISNRYSSTVIIPRSIVEASFKGSNTSNVTSMNDMFSGCSGLTALDVSSFDTSKVTNMSNMFEECRGLTSLDVSSFDTSNVIDMNSMFSGCASLTSLTLSNFNTSNVTSMDTMFNDCTKLESLDLSGWDTSKVTSMGTMFRRCNALKRIFMSGCTENTITSIETQLKNDGITGFHIFQSQS